MAAQVAEFCRNCLICLKTRGGATIPRPPGETDKPRFPNECVHFDFFYVRPATSDTPEGYEYVLVLVDAYSRFVELIPAVGATAAVTVQSLLGWFSRYGIAYKWTSDQGQHFAAQIVSQLATTLGAHHHFTPVYAPWANGRVERMNKQIHEVLSAYIISSGLPEHQWPNVLPLVQFVINNTPTTTLAGHAPITVFQGRQPSSPVRVVFDGEDVLSSVSPPADFSAAVTRAQQAIADAIDDIEQQPARRPALEGKPVDFGVGDYVLTARPDVTTRDKTSPVWEGPAVVVEQIHELLFRVRDVASGRERELHARFLKRYADKDLVVTPDIIAAAAHGSRGFQILKIHGQRQMADGTWQVRVQWAGPPVVSTWEPIDVVFQDSPVTVRAYVNRIRDEAKRTELQAILKSLGPVRRRR